ncbi:MAG: hypothetical protein H0T92_16835 [Pyrinomonadaceae bacterium]|nr:hypothetical protein [Pyrinomonadaceae bacterium]
MNKDTNQRVNFAAAASLIVLLSYTPVVLSQNTTPTNSLNSPAPSSTVESAGKEKAEAILQRGIEALGGRAYLDVRTIIGRGIFTQFQDGKSGLPSQFLDYLIFPDRERTEFRAQGVRTIQTNVGTSGWIYDGAARTLRNMTPKQTEDFRFAMRTSVDNLLRGWWRKEEAQLSYVGRREAGLARRNEVVRLTYRDGFTVEFEFGAKDYLPAKSLYKRTIENQEEVAEEDRFAQFITIKGVTLPLVIDHFRAGVQTSRINYELVEFNLSIPDSLFARPADVKALK